MPQSILICKYLHSNHWLKMMEPENYSFEYNGYKDVIEYISQKLEVGHSYRLLKILKYKQISSKI